MPRKPLDFITNVRAKVNEAGEFQTILKGALDDARYLHELDKARLSAESAIHVKVLTCKVGDQVWALRKLFTDAYTCERPTAKLSSRHFGSYKITALVGENAVRIVLPSHMHCHKAVHVRCTRSFSRNRLQSGI